LYSIIGVNRDLIFSKPLSIVPAAVIVVATTFILGWAIQKTCVLFKVDKKNIISLVLQGTLKNQGIAGGLALALFEKEAALPAAIYSISMILYIMWLDWRTRKG
jgi:BASS family bile acid:Na+ symporter